MFADPMVRTMTLVALALVIVFLATVIGVLLSGITARTGPRTLSEKELAVAGAAVRKGGASSSTYGEYVAALIAEGQYAQAQSVIDQGKAAAPDTSTAEFSVAEVRLHSAQKEYQQSISLADKAQKQIEAVHKATIEGGGLKAKRAIISGLPDNWYILALLKADAYKGLGDWAKAVKEFDAYIGGNPGAADILIDRGNAKIAAKDTAGAEADFKAALKFVPGDKEALQGLAKIGAANK